MVKEQNVHGPIGPSRESGKRRQNRCSNKSIRCGRSTAACVAVAKLVSLMLDSPGGGSSDIDGLLSEAFAAAEPYLVDESSLGALAFPKRSLKSHSSTPEMST